MSDQVSSPVGAGHPADIVILATARRGFRAEFYASVSQFTGPDSISFPPSQDCSDERHSIRCEMLLVPSP